jgi:hypothetical protein
MTRSPSARCSLGLRNFGSLCNRLKEDICLKGYLASAIMTGAWLAIGVPVSASANVITDWDEKAVAVVMPPGLSACHSRFTRLSEPWEWSTPRCSTRSIRLRGATNSIWRNCPQTRPRPRTPRLLQLPRQCWRQSMRKPRVQLKSPATYLASIPDQGSAKADGIKLGEAVAAKVLEARANDDHDAADDDRPRTAPGVYVPTAITAAST